MASKASWPDVPGPSRTRAANGSRPSDSDWTAERVPKPRRKHPESCDWKLKLKVGTEFDKNTQFFLPKIAVDFLLLAGTDSGSDVEEEIPDIFELGQI